MCLEILPLHWALPYLILSQSRAIFGCQGSIINLKFFLLLLIKCLVHVRLLTKHLICIMSFNHHNRGKASIRNPCLRNGTGAERRRNLPEVAEPVSGRGRTQTQVDLTGTTGSASKARRSAGWIIWVTEHWLGAFSSLLAPWPTNKLCLVFP